MGTGAIGIHSAARLFHLGFAWTWPERMGPGQHQGCRAGGCPPSYPPSGGQKTTAEGMLGPPDLPHLAAYM